MPCVRLALQHNRLPPVQKTALSHLGIIIIHDRLHNIETNKTATKIIIPCIRMILHLFHKESKILWSVSRLPEVLKIKIHLAWWPKMNNKSYFIYDFWFAIISKKHNTTSVFKTRLFNLNSSLNLVLNKTTH